MSVESRDGGTPKGAVFLSYASQDAEAAKRICEALRAAGVEVWFDQNELEGGDAWDVKIRKQIKDCALFIPVISANTQARLEGYFRIEWKLAAHRTHAMAEEKTFLLPVVIDATRDTEAKVPGEFREVQWTRLSDGENTAAFVARVAALLGSVSESRATAVVSLKKSPAGTGDSRRGSPRWLVPSILGVVAVAAAAAWFSWRAQSAAVEAPRRATATSIAISEKSIAILPFENRSPGPDSEFFADGVHEDLLTNLSYVRDLRVVPRIIAMRYRATKLRPRELGAELRVAYLVAGTVRRVGTTVRVTGELIDARTEQGRWNWQRDYEGTDVMAIQSAMATAIAAELRVVLSPQEQKLIARRPTESVDAYNAYLGARAYRHAQTTALPNAQREALALVAVEADPKFAEAWAELARVRASFGMFGLPATNPRVAKAVEAIETARRLAPDLPEVLLAEGEVYYKVFRDFVRATSNYQRVLQLQPGNPEVHQQLGAVQRRQGKWLEALASTRRAVEIDPKFVGGWLDLRHSYAFGRRFDEALSAMRRIVELEPTTGNVRWLLLDTVRFGRSTDELRAWVAKASPEDVRSGSTWEANVLLGEYEKNLALNYPEGSALKVAWALAAKGDMASARAQLSDGVEALRKLAETEPGQAGRWARLAASEAMLGQNEDARRHAEKAVELVPLSRDAIEGAAMSHTLAVVMAWTGDKAGALDLLGRLLLVPGTCSDSNSPLTVITLRHDPRYAPLWGDPRFEALLKDPKNNAPLF